MVFEDRHEFYFPHIDDTERKLRLRISASKVRIRAVDYQPLAEGFRYFSTSKMIQTKTPQNCPVTTCPHPVPTKLPPLPRASCL